MARKMFIDSLLRDFFAHAMQLRWLCLSILNRDAQFGLFAR